MFSLLTCCVRFIEKGIKKCPLFFVRIVDYCFWKLRDGQRFTTKNVSEVGPFARFRSCYYAAALSTSRSLFPNDFRHFFANHSSLCKHPAGQSSLVSPRCQRLPRCFRLLARDPFFRPHGYCVGVSAVASKCVQVAGVTSKNGEIWLIFVRKTC